MLSAELSESVSMVKNQSSGEKFADWFLIVLTDYDYSKVLSARLVYTVSQKKTVQISFCQNFVKFPPILVIFGRKMAKGPKLCESTQFLPHLIRVTTLPC